MTELIKPIKGSNWGGSRYSTFQTCAQKHFWSYEYEGSGLVPIGDRVAASRGTMVHLGIQAFYALPFTDPEAYAQMTYADRATNAIHYAVNHIDALAISEEEKILMRDMVISALDQYFQKYEFDTNLEVLGVETPITIEFPFGIKYTGVRDMLAVWQGHPVVPDHKTTSLNWDTFFKKWKFDLSLRGYCYERWKATGKIHHILINGIRFTKRKDHSVEFEREIIFMSERDMEEFERTILHLSRQMDVCRTAGFWPKSGQQCVHVYGVCDYRKLCDFPDPSMIKTFYRRRGDEGSDAVDGGD